MDAVVAVYSDWGIGRDGTQPVTVPADRKHFREVTGSGTVIVGRKTLEDFPGGRPLKNRRNIVLTRQNITIEGAETAHSAEEAAAMAEKDENVFVIGGESVYSKLLPYCRRAFVTKLFVRPESDAFFPDLDAAEGWSLESEGPVQEHENIKFCFTVYVNNKAGW